MDYLISQQEGIAFLNQLLGLPMVQLSSVEDGTIVMGFGQLFEVSNLEFSESGPYEVKKVVPQFALSVQCGLAFLVKDHGKDGDISEKCLLTPQFMTQLQGNCVEQICLTEKGEVVLQLAEMLIRIKSSTSTSPSWRLFQPETEEDHLLGGSCYLVRRVRLRRRWSKQHAAVRDQWHSF